MMVSGRGKSADGMVRSERRISPSPSVYLLTKVSGLNEERVQIRFKLSGFSTISVVNRLGSLFSTFVLEYFLSFLS